MFLIETPNDKRTWEYPTYNCVAKQSSSNYLKLLESESGNIFIEEYYDKKSNMSYFFRISSDKYKSINSISVKRYSVA